MIALGNMRKREVKKTSTDPIKRNSNTKINGLHEIPTENKIYREKKKWIPLTWNKHIRKVIGNNWNILNFLIYREKASRIRQQEQTGIKFNRIIQREPIVHVLGIHEGNTKNIRWKQTKFGESKGGRERLTESLQFERPSRLAEYRETNYYKVDSQSSPRKEEENSGKSVLLWGESVPKWPTAVKPTRLSISTR